jgi:aspartyl/asparaginyl-tRNA synthetase
LSPILGFMQRTPIAALASTPRHEVLVAGFVDAIRVLKRMIFVVVHDRSGRLQVTIERAPSDQLPSALESVALGLTLGSAVRVRGLVSINPAVKIGGLELLASALEIASAAEPGLPIDEHSATDLQLDWRFLALRRPENQLVFEVQTTMERAMRAYWAAHGFIELHSPKLMHSASESGADTFATRYFELGTAYLAQSPQFYKQMAIAAGFERVFEIAPVFRAEPSMTPRHAAEFTSVDVEMAWVESHEDVMRMEEEWLRHVLTTVRAEHGEVIERQFGVEVRVPALPFPRLPMREAHAMLRSEGHEIAKETKPGDIDPAGERRLARWALEAHGSEFFFLTEYPAALRPFYHMRDERDPTLTKSFDLLWKSIEITTGAQREHRLAELSRQAEQAGLRESVSYYLDFFRYGCPPHGGFGLGLARLVMLLLGLPSIREATFLHRGPHRLTP